MIIEQQQVQHQEQRLLQEVEEEPTWLVIPSIPSLTFHLQP
jgi:hypothetical protein